MTHKKEPIDIDLEKNLIQDGPKFRSHVVIIDTQIAYLKPTISAMMFCFVYIVVGAFLIGVSINVYISSQQLDLSIFVGGFGIAIFTFGCTLIQPFLYKASFDKDTGRFINNNDRSVKLKNIVSLQINNKLIKRKQGLNYPCYELNMLTKNGRRINVLNHNDIDQMIHDTHQLSEFLNIEYHDLRRELRAEL